MIKNEKIFGNFELDRIYQMDCIERMKHLPANSIRNIQAASVQHWQREYIELANNHLDDISMQEDLTDSQLLNPLQKGQDNRKIIL